MQKAKTEHETGMLEYLEDIIGSNRLVEAIEKTGKEVDTINEERGQKVTSLSPHSRAAHTTGCAFAVAAIQLLLPVFCPLHTQPCWEYWHESMLTLDAGHRDDR
jgi:hypothetical protein